MSRRLLPTSTSDNPYQPTTVAKLYHPAHAQRAPPCREHYRNGGGHPPPSRLSDDTFTDTYTDYYHHPRSYSDESGSVRLPDYIDNESRRPSRNTYSTRSYGWRDKVNPLVHKDVRRVHPHYGAEAGVYHEIETAAPKRPPTSRPQSSMSSGVTSAVVDGCGGKCQTFENVCYFFLQLIFIMGILIGVSLCIAGLVLRKSAAKNLQVLVYIGMLLAVVSGALLGIQWNARNAAKRRKMAVRNAKRAPIPLETLHRGQVQQPLMTGQDGQRIMPQSKIPLPPQSDQQGIPWWRRKDLA